MLDHKEVEKTIKIAKQKIEKAKEDLADAKAQKRTLLNTLKKDFGYDNVIEAEQAIQKFTKNLEILNQEIEDKYKQLKEKYAFDI